MEGQDGYTHYKYMGKNVAVSDLIWYIFKWMNGP